MTYEHTVENRQYSSISLTESQSDVEYDGRPRSCRRTRSVSAFPKSVRVRGKNDSQTACPGFDQLDRASTTLPNVLGTKTLTIRPNTRLTKHNPARIWSLPDLEGQRKGARRMNRANHSDQVISEGGGGPVGEDPSGDFLSPLPLPFFLPVLPLA
jgi:hypothetical protein